ncbi:uncharacterized protein LOC117283045 [Cryptotermes secundus]|uniref:uncharacterized protein LOC117283045 n=1 Tax=Cryptotermes secundus TaxID=105785 RepID=UPI001454DEA8|nr:uncharacterized protein LOC117283045 [Cryptotermes secundus]
MILASDSIGEADVVSRDFLTIRAVVNEECTITSKYGCLHTGQQTAFIHINVPKLVTVAKRPKACTVFTHSEAGILVSNPTQGMGACEILSVLAGCLSLLIQNNCNYPLYLGITFINNLRTQRQDAHSTWRN